MKNKYAVIVGHGRSGTNWLHELFNFSEETYCRNEPHELQSSPISQFNHYRVVVRNDPALLLEQWDNTIDIIANKMGNIDPWIKEEKQYFKSAKFIYIIFRSNKIRKILSYCFKSLKNDEWSFPVLAVNKTEWKKAYRIFKFVQSPGWTDFLLNNKKDVNIFHIVRHPGGFLNSWKNRYLSPRDSEGVHAANIRRLKDISQESARWGNIFGDIDRLGLNESELWYWYYANQTIFEAGRGKAAYTLIQYEELTKQPVNILEKLYRAVGLKITDKIRSQVTVSSEDSESISTSWRNKLSVKDVALCERFYNLARESFLT